MALSDGVGLTSWIVSEQGIFFYSYDARDA